MVHKFLLQALHHVRAWHISYCCRCCNASVHNAQTARVETYQWKVCKPSLHVLKHITVHITQVMTACVETFPCMTHKLWMQVLQHVSAWCTSYKGLYMYVSGRWTSHPCMLWNMSVHCAQLISVYGAKTVMVRFIQPQNTITCTRSTTLRLSCCEPLMNRMAVDKCKAKVADKWWVSEGLQVSEDENDSLKGHKGRGQIMRLGLRQRNNTKLGNSPY